MVRAKVIEGHCANGSIVRLQNSLEVERLANPWGEFTAR